MVTLSLPTRVGGLKHKFQMALRVSPSLPITTDRARVPSFANSKRDVAKALKSRNGSARIQLGSAQECCGAELTPGTDTHRVQAALPSALAARIAPESARSFPAADRP
jgi:hypothetical protein